MQVIQNVRMLSTSKSADVHKVQFVDRGVLVLKCTVIVSLTIWKIQSTLLCPSKKHRYQDSSNEFPVRCHCTYVVPVSLNTNDAEKCISCVQMVTILGKIGLFVFIVFNVVYDYIRCASCNGGGRPHILPFLRHCWAPV